jgi:threonine synthase
VKAVTSDLKFKKANNLTSINSFNWARVMMQTVHYIYTYLKVVDSIGQQVTYAVPTGAMGNSAAGMLVKQMGLPIHKILLATNVNDVVGTMWRTGNFVRPASEVVATNSPAIDISVPYNMERILYLMNCNTAQLMQCFDKDGVCSLSESELHTFRQIFDCASTTPTQTVSTISTWWHTYRYVLDPHTAVAVHAVQKTYSHDDSKTGPILVMATAHPAKFEETIIEAIGFEPNIPASIKALETAADHGKANYGKIVQDPAALVALLHRDIEVAVQHVQYIQSRL